MKNLLIPEEYRNRIDYSGGRRTGKSTAQALVVLSQAIQNPGEPVTIVDHAGAGRASQHLAYLVEHIADSIGLLYIKVEKDKRGFFTVTSNHIV